LAAAGALTRRAFPHGMPREAAPLVPNLDPNTLARFVDPLPLPVMARPLGTHADLARHGEQARHYRVAMRAISSKLHRDLPPAGLWSYGGCPA
jgi:spore coat protein A